MHSMHAMQTGNRLSRIAPTSVKNASPTESESPVRKAIEHTAIMLCYDVEPFVKYVYSDPCAGQARDSMTRLVLPGFSEDVVGNSRVIEFNAWKLM